MEEDGAITSARAFLLRAKIFGSDAPIKAGEYRIPAHARNRDILNILQSGKVIARLVTIPEGMPSLLVYERSEERRVGHACVSTCRSRCSPSHYTKTNTHKQYTQKQQ